MKSSLLEWLACPVCHEALTLREAAPADAAEIESGELACRSDHRFPIRKGIPRFVEGDVYVKNFSFQWWEHRTTQVDRYGRHKESTRKFQSDLDVPLSWLKGKRVLDIGCGPGRFMDVALAEGAEVVGVDLSFAVDAARANLGMESRAHFIQGDVFALPFKPETFDLVFSFGVLHHTPDCRRAFEALPPLTRPGGKVSICLYSAYERVLVVPGNFWRKILNRLPPRLLYAICHLAGPLYYPYRIPVIGHFGKMIWNISMRPEWRWRILDTYDWYSPKYQSAHTHPEVFRWFKEAGLTDIQVLESGISMLGNKPAPAPMPLDRRPEAAARG